MRKHRVHPVGSWISWSMAAATAALVLWLAAPVRADESGGKEGKGEREVKESREERDGKEAKADGGQDRKGDKGKDDKGKDDKADRSARDEGGGAKGKDGGKDDGKDATEAKARVEGKEAKEGKEGRAGRGDTADVPPPVRKTAERHAPGLRVDSVKTKEVGSHTVYIIEGDSLQRDVWLTIEEDGDILDARFRPHPEGQKPPKKAPPQEELPAKVKQTVERVVPGLTLESVKVRDVKGEGKVYQVDGGWTQDRHALLFVEEDGDLRTVQISRPRGAPKPGERPNRDPNED